MGVSPLHNIICRENTWYFNRRVPVEVKEYDPRKLIRYSLKTDSRKIAKRLASKENQKLEQYWSSLIATGAKHCHDQYKNLVERASLFGFQYQHVNQIAIGDFLDLFNRLKFVENDFSEKRVEAVFGTETPPEITLSEIFPIFLGLTKSVEVEKSEKQYIKWKNPRELAMRNVISALGNKTINSFTKDDANKIKDWYLSRIKAKEISFGTADKLLIYTKTMISTVCEDRKIKLDISHVFNKFLFNVDDKKQRPPFSTNHIINVLLNPIKLAGLSQVNQALLKIFAETGVCVDEIVGVRPNEIFLEGKIPYFLIKPHEKDKLKTKHRERLMPLVGYALDAFQQFPQGFSELVSDIDSTNSAIAKYLRQNNLLETPKHSAYSLRHSFQDRLTNLDCNDRIQTDLMGHAFRDRTKYGTGATLEKKFEWMKKIQLK
ncbi:DUF6538 domain-containing protein [Pedobacter suwonensis]|uniref:DUF6538 domain-containing protein n=1 Tax=Pedobacter suwonensis TaxID=332999 RepID=UPI001356295A|nr:DUF6538 domain-containing protein [Pedobacter suwonensis]